MNDNLNDSAIIEFSEQFGIWISRNRGYWTHYPLTPRNQKLVGKALSGKAAGIWIEPNCIKMLFTPKHYSTTRNKRKYIKRER